MRYSKSRGRIPGPWSEAGRVSSPKTRRLHRREGSCATRSRKTSRSGLVELSWPLLFPAKGSMIASLPLRLVIANISPRANVNLRRARRLAGIQALESDGFAWPIATVGAGQETAPQLRPCAGTLYGTGVCMANTCAWCGMNRPDGARCPLPEQGRRLDRSSDDARSGRKGVALSLVLPGRSLSRRASVGVRQAKMAAG
jgi:hypothetical protein